MLQEEEPAAASSASAIELEGDDSSSSSAAEARASGEPTATLTFFDGAAMIVGMMIGSGIFASPGNVLGHAGSVGASLLIWVFSGCFILGGCLCYAELGTAMPQSGGEYVYLGRAYGPTTAFLFTWTQAMVLKPGSQAIISLIFARYLGALFVPGIDPADSELDSNWGIRIVGLSALLFIHLLNATGVGLAALFQRVTTVLKLIAIGLVILLGFIALAGGVVDGETARGRFHDAFDGTKSFSNLGLAVVSSLWPFDGFSSGNAISGELKNPRRDLPLALVLGIPGVTLCYLLVNIAYIAILPYDEVVASKAIGMATGEAMMGDFGRYLMPLAVAISSLGAANASCFTGARVLAAASRRGDFPFASVFGKLHSKRETPVAALIFQFCCSSALLLLGNFESLVSYFSFAAWIFYGLTAVSVLVLRHREPDLARPFRVPVALPPLFACVAAFLVVNTFVRAFLASCFALSLVLLGGPVYLGMLYMRRRKERNEEHHQPIAQL